MVEPSSEQAPRPWEPLKQAFIAHLHASASPSLAVEIWRLFADDRWFREQLEVHARKVLTARTGRVDWLDDVKHEVLLSLARQFDRTPDLRVDLSRVDSTFPAWIGAILDRACGEAVRLLIRLDRLEHGAVEKVADPRARDLADTRIDVSLAVGAQEEPYRTLLMLSAKGYSIQEIAQQLGLTYWETYGRLHAGLGQLGRRLASYRQKRDTPPGAAPVSSSSSTPS